VGPAAAPAPPGGAPSPHASLDGSSGEEARLAAETALDSLATQLRAMGLQDSPPSLTPAQSLQVLQQCAARSVPQPADTQWQSVPQRPRPPPVPIPASYPAQRPAIFDSPSLYEKLDAETLFFIFYNQPGSYQQHLAARELKRQAWRFHKQHSAWFQRHEEPKAGGQPGDDWEQGTYVYFDSTLQDQAGGVGGRGGPWRWLGGGTSTATCLPWALTTACWAADLRRQRLLLPLEAILHLPLRPAGRRGLRRGTAVLC
jgi:CCR4-NOT transcription complex subunit 3